VAAAINVGAAFVSNAEEGAWHKRPYNGFYIMTALSEWENFY
jgi:hypothetical protein